MSERFVYYTIERYHSTGDVDRVRSGCPCSVQTKMAISSRISRNPLQKQKIVARKIKINARSVSCILNHDLDVRIY